VAASEAGRKDKIEVLVVRNLNHLGEQRDLYALSEARFYP